jgi:O-methyltransferase
MSMNQSAVAFDEITNVFKDKTVKVRDWREYFAHVMSIPNRIPGAFVELGFGKGNSCNFVVKLMNDGLLDKRDIWIYDSFEGFPEPTPEDTSPRNATKGEHRWPIDPALDIKDKISTNVEVVKGFVEDTLPHSYTGGDIAVLHIDLDLYSGYKTALNSLYDKVIKGGVILFDEYRSPRQLRSWPGASLAVDEFFFLRKIEPSIEMGLFPFPREAMQKFFMIKK